MSKAKSILIVALVCANLALVAGVVVIASAPPAKAQIIGAGTDYLVVTGRVANDEAAVYIVDLAKQAMAVWEFDKTAKRLQPVGGRSLENDFRVRGGRAAN